MKFKFHAFARHGMKTDISEEVARAYRRRWADSYTLEGSTITCKCVCMYEYKHIYMNRIFVAATTCQLLLFLHFYNGFGYNCLHLLAHTFKNFFSSLFLLLCLFFFFAFYLFIFFFLIFLFHLYHCNLLSAGVCILACFLTPSSPSPLASIFDFSFSICLYVNLFAICLYAHLNCNFF